MTICLIRCVRIVCMRALYCICITNLSYLSLLLSKISSCELFKIFRILLTIIRMYRNNNDRKWFHYALDLLRHSLLFLWLSDRGQYISKVSNYRKFKAKCAYLYIIIPGDANWRTTYPFSGNWLSYQILQHIDIHTYIYIVNIIALYLL